MGTPSTAAFFGDPFNPSVYRLTTKEGTVYEYGQFSGLDNIIDRNGNRLDFRIDGIFSSQGPSIQFVRDGQGRITRIVDPSGQVRRYDYDLQGGLASITDPVDQTTRFEYTAGAKRLLNKVINPDGTVTLAANFDSAGRLLSSTNAANGTVSNLFDLAARSETSIDPLGKATTVQFDERGNIARVVQPSGGVVQFTYDANDNLTLAVDEAGYTLQRQFDSRGNIVRMVDPLGAVYVSTFNEENQLTSATDSQGRTTSNVYSPKGELLRFVNAEGVVSSGTFDDRGRAISQTDGRGNTTRFGFTNATRATSIVFPITPPAGGAEPEEPVPPTRKYEYNDLGQVIRETDENGNVTQNFYDAIGRPLRTVDPMGATFLYAWTNDRLTSATDPLGRVTRYEYDSLGRRVKTIDPAGGVTTVAYDAKNQVTELKDPLGRITRYSYTDDARLKEQRDALVNTTTYEYDALGNRTAVIDALQKRFDYVYDAMGRLLRSIDPLGRMTQTEYDSAGNPIRVTDARGNTTQFRYDNLNRLVEAIDATGNSVQREYDANGNVVRAIDENGNAIRYEYDQRDRMIRSIDAAEFQEQQAFDAVGNRVSYTDPTGETTHFTYDMANRGISTTTPLGAFTTRTFDAFGNTVRFRNELGETISLEINAMNQIAAVASTDGRVTRYGYDEAGNRTRVIDPTGNLTRFDYDGLNQLITETNTLDNSLQYRFDAVGNLSSQVDRNGRTIEYQYDAARQLQQEKWLDGTTIVRTITTHHDAVGNIVEILEPNRRLAYEFDSLNRVVQQDAPLAGTTDRLVHQWQYNPLGLPTQITDNRGTALANIYDGRNLPRSTSMTGPTIDEMRAAFTYDSRGNRTRTDRFWGSDLSQPIGSTTQVFDRLGRLTSSSHTDRSQAQLDQFTYEYGKLFRVTSESNSRNSASFQYDHAGQLTQRDNTVHADEAYQYDASGNRLGAAVQNGTNNQLLRDATFNYAYDRQGYLTTKTNRSNGEVTRFNYDHRQRMVLAATSSPSGQLLRQVRFEYDALNRRTSIDNGSSVIYTSYLGEVVWADYDAQGNLLAQYLPSVNLDEHLARYRPAEGVAWYLTDRLGSVLSIVDQQGAVLSRMEYDSFGVVISESRPESGDRFKFTGRELDRETGLYYYRARYMDPATGKFLSEDPLEFSAGDLNLQRYVGNDPVNHTDPLGLQSIAAFGSLLSFVQSYANFALTYGADVPFTYRIACKPGACGISGAVDDTNTVSLTGVPVPGSDGKVTFDLTASNDPSGPPIKVKANVTLVPGVVASADTTGKCSLSPSVGRFSNSISCDGTMTASGPGGSYTTEKTKLPAGPNLPPQGEFNFVVISTAKSPHLLISANIAIYVGVAQELELIAKAVTAPDWATQVEVAYEKTVDNPSAAVRARGFATLPIRPLSPVPNPDGPSPNNGTRPRPSKGNPNDNGNDNNDDDDDDDGPDGDASTDPPTAHFGDGGVAAAGDFVWVDVDRDGVQDSNEPGVSNAVVKLFSPGADGQIGGLDDLLLASTTTNLFGYYLFDSLAPGIYYMALDLSTLPAGFVPTLRFAGPPSIDSDADNAGFTGKKQRCQESLFIEMVSDVMP